MIHTLMMLAAVAVVSPDGLVRGEFDLADGEPKVEISRDGKALGTLGVGPVYRSRGYGRYEVLKSESRVSKGAWKPVWGFRAEDPDNYTETKVELALPGKAETAMIVFLRAYDEGFAVRYEFPFESYALDEVRRERFDLDLPAGAVAWPIDWTEATYPEEPLAVKELDTSTNWRMPFTLRTPDGLYASVLEAHTVRWPRSFLRADGRGGLKSVFVISTKTGREYERSPWRVVLLAPSAGGLVERAYLVENLNEPCAVKDAADWIRPGLTTCDFGKLDNASLLADAKRVKEVGVRYLQIDWGWYGTERSWTDAERAGYRARRPDLRDEDWVANTYADPRRPAKGYVPYHPTWERLITYGRKGVDLDIPSLVRDLKAMGMGLCLYVHGVVLEANDLEDLFSLYEKWGVAGLKPGFVSWGTQQATDYLREMAACAARHHLWLDIHDAQIPDGFERTWPNVMITEGGGGEEGHHPVHQDAVLPFARCLAGPFDYTPRFFDPERTRAHAAAMLVVYPGPTAVMRWPRDGKTTIDALRAENPELFAFTKSLPFDYDETVVPVAEIAKRIVVARRRGTTWYVGGISGTEASEVDFAADFLESGCDFNLTLVGDEAKADRTIRRGERIAVRMSPGGGFVARLAKVER